jgi:hypothetical protein
VAGEKYVLPFPKKIHERAEIYTPSAPIDEFYEHLHIKFSFEISINQEFDKYLYYPLYFPPSKFPTLQYVTFKF